MATAITSVESLNSMKEGERIQVRSRQIGARQWTKDSSGWFIRDGAAVGAEFFVGYINDGRVSIIDDQPVTVGDWYSQGRYDYVLLDRSADGSFFSLTFNDGVFRGEHQYEARSFEGAQFLRQEGMPPRVMGNADSVRRLFEVQQDMLTTRSQLVLQMQEQQRQKPEAAPAAPETERVVVTMTIAGSTLLEGDLVRRLLDLPRNTRIEMGLVNWTYDKQYTHVGAPGVCACGTVDRSKIVVPTGTTTWDVEARCPYGHEGNLDTF